MMVGPLLKKKLFYRRSRRRVEEGRGEGGGGRGQRRQQHRRQHAEEGGARHRRGHQERGQRRRRQDQERRQVPQREERHSKIYKPNPRLYWDWIRFSTMHEHGQALLGYRYVSLVLWIRKKSSDPVSICIVKTLDSNLNHVSTAIWQRTLWIPLDKIVFSSSKSWFL